MAFWWRGESLFPLGPRRPSWTISPRTPGQRPAPRFASARNGITRTPSPPYASSSTAPCSASPADASFALSGIYTLVVLGGLCAVRVFKADEPRLLRGVLEGGVLERRLRRQLDPRVPWGRR